MNKKGLFYTFRIKGRKRSESGIFIDEGTDWILIRSLFSDYLIDGYKIINKNYIVSVSRNEEDIFTEKVLKANNKDNYSVEKIPLETNSLFNYLKEQQIVFDISIHLENSTYVGKIKKILTHSFYLYLLSPKGEWLDEIDLFKKKSIRLISFNTDYIQSLLNYNRTLNS
ncbi:hypothetical protein [Bacteroides sp. 519]|uniref:hypothetical protein n=1 Tax=Bacteroides sp. 519 TaxID=2302937 RepID=UPI0013D69123|nr:hypothetical protein [Bacteroides sp. 519]NDV58954.1 hypothetical protein [Bacteroides sp. 519]